jgi:hypothetical protein
MFSRAMKQYIPDNQSGYRLYSRRLIEAAIKSQEHGFEFEVEVIFRCVMEGYSLAWVPIMTIYAGQKSHIKPIRHLLHFLRITARARALMKDSSKAK